VITYVDTSAFLKLVVDEEGSEVVGRLWDEATVVVAARILYVEARAVLAAATRAGRLVAGMPRRARANLEDLWGQLAVVEVTGALVGRAGDIAERRALRGFDAVHLTAALDVRALIFLSADRQLCQAASHEGLHVAGG
jgi:predicted nucleic acid-binding protein